MADYTNSKKQGGSQDQPQKHQHPGGQEPVEFHSSMPEVKDEDLEFIPDEQLEEKIENDQS